MTPFDRKLRIRWLLLHPAWSVDQEGLYVQNWGFDKAVSLLFVHVNPETEKIDKDDNKNVAFRVWIEAGPPWREVSEHVAQRDIRLDCSAASADAALLKLADLVDAYYSELTGMDIGILERLGELK